MTDPWEEQERSEQQWAYEDALREENEKLRTLLSGALIVMGFSGRQYLDEYLREEDGTTLIRELKSVGIEVDR